jgi:hypothetical protein
MLSVLRHHSLLRKNSSEHSMVLLNEYIVQHMPQGTLVICLGYYTCWCSYAPAAPTTGPYSANTPTLLTHHIQLLQLPC